MGSDVPDVAGRIGHRARAVAVELVLHRSYQLGTGGQRALHDAIDVLDVQHDADRRAADPAGPNAPVSGWSSTENVGGAAVWVFAVPVFAPGAGEWALSHGAERLFLEGDDLPPV